MNFYTWDNTDLLLHCYLQPKARKNQIIGFYNNQLKISLTAPPIDGKANAHLLAFIASTFSVSKKHVHLESGKKSRSKRVRVNSPKMLPLTLGIIRPSHIE